MATSEGSDPGDPEVSRPSLVHARLRLALDAAGMGLWDWDLDTGRLLWDERSAHMYGTSLAEATGDISDVDAHLHPDDLERVRDVLAAAIEAGGAVDVEFRTVWPDGSVRWVHASGRAVADETGRTTAVVGINVDVTERREAARARIADAQRMAGLVGVAQSLGEAQTESDVLAVVAQHGSAALGARSTGLALRTPGLDHVRLLLVGQLGDDRAELSVLPPGTPLAVVDAATTGRAHFLPDREAAAAHFPGAERLYERAGTEAAAAVPLRARGELLGALSVGFDGPHEWRPSERELLETLAALTAQALERVAARRAEREVARASRRLSETLQRSLLSEPAALPLVDLAVRYLSAEQEAQVGGDWYDAFLAPDGGTTVVVGDVAGHDRDSAAAMAQVRNILRGVAVTTDGGPAEILRRLDLALERLQVPTLATAVLGQLRALPDRLADPSGAGRSPAPEGSRVALTWSNAGHPPPLLLAPGGAAELLAREPDLLLGLLPGDARTDHELPLPAGSTVLLYTDGLVERRGQSLDDGLDRLARVAAGLAGLGVHDLADAVLGALAEDAEDDVVLLVARVLEPSSPRTGGPR